MRMLICIAAVITTACGEFVRQGTAPVHLLVDTLEGTTGAGEFHGDIHSDVMTDGHGAGIQAPDFAKATLSIALKDPGPGVAPNQPSSNNFVTVNRYRVRYVRADGRNTPGVDVPYAFDGAFTVTISNRASATFTLVRAQAKSEAPLAALARNASILSTIAEVTFFGRDQTGRDVQAHAAITVHFANWPDQR